MSKEEAQEVPPTATEKDTAKDNDNAGPFDSFQISSHEYLKTLGDRAKCENCNATRKYFCYTCFRPVGDIDRVPQMRLPIQLNIIHHPKEPKSKKTSIHAKVLAPLDVVMFDDPDIPDYRQEKDEVLLLFPSPDAKNISEIDVTKYKKIIVIDSTWSQTKGILRNERLQGLQCVRIQTYETKFWRYQDHGREFLATIEAIYYFYREYQQRINGGVYRGEMDNLLYYFSFFYNLIQGVYKKNNKEFNRIEGYVKLEPPTKAIKTDEAEK
ncbi:hypothetical protein PROFUN_14806 [Planoprotostelium fungivorum]|uniref:tRNA-uridine aminocarboxypropyltransferase 1 n=1 Tax=Planoprotostelium fungivorum TaxID=1890364 RepID=A0A2P6MYR2_9EUKA|nr:hypothetical protein PROFUN_14806 [Planoprotostelium fungivorum]